MPFASTKLIEAANRILVEKEADIVIPRVASEADKGSAGFEPLHAVYRQATCLPAIEAAIGADQWKVIAWFPQVKVRVLTPTELESLDPDGLAFWNVNTPEEFAEAERISLSLHGRASG
jgi:molybdopterin-guanine dinucleotide biosynthesis protein A